MATQKVGGEVDAFCTRCKLSLAHTVLAIVGTKVARVRCNTCGGDHAYRAEPGARTPRAASSRASPRPAKVVVTFEQQLAGKDLSKARKYSPKERFALDDLVDHPTFGLGLVTALRDEKIDIAFKAATKTLVHGRGEAGARPTFQPPRAGSAAPADKPRADGDQPSDLPEDGLNPPAPETSVPAELET